MNVPMFSHPLNLMSESLIDSRWARPFVFRDISLYPLARAAEVNDDFNHLVDSVNQSMLIHRMDKYMDGLLRIVDNHIARCGRLLFCDLLMYVDCLAYLCYASDLMTESQIVTNYASWVKFIVELRKCNLFCSSFWGVTSFEGSFNETHLNSCF